MMLLELEVTGLKAVAAAVLFIACIGGGLLPFLLKQRSQRRAKAKALAAKAEKEKAASSTSPPPSRCNSVQHDDPTTTASPPIRSASYQPPRPQPSTPSGRAPQPQLVQPAPVHTIVVQGSAGLSLQAAPSTAPASPTALSSAAEADDPSDALGTASPLAPAPADAPADVPADALRHIELFPLVAAAPGGKVAALEAEHSPSHGRGNGNGHGHGHSHAHSHSSDGGAAFDGLSSKPKRKRKRWCNMHMDVDRFLSFGNMFGAGIFLGGGLLHLLPEAQQALAEVQEGWTDGALHPIKDFPVSFFLAGIGFYTILLVEEVTISLTTRNKQRKEKKILREKEERAEAKHARLLAGTSKRRGSAGATGFAPIVISDDSLPSTPRMRRPRPAQLHTLVGSLSGFDSDRSASPFGDPLKRDMERNLVQGLTTRIMLLPAMPFRKPRRRRPKRRGNDAAVTTEMGVSLAAATAAAVAVVENSLNAVSVTASAAPLLKYDVDSEAESELSEEESAGPIQQFLDAADNSPSPFPSLTAADPLITRRLQSRLRHAHRTRRGSYPADDSDSNMMYAAAAARGRGSGADSPYDLGSPLVSSGAAGSAFDFGVGTPTSAACSASSRAVAGNATLGREDVKSAPPVAVPAQPAPALAVAQPATPSSVAALCQPLLVKPDASDPSSSPPLTSQQRRKQSIEPAAHDHDHDHKHSHSHSHSHSHDPAPSHGHGSEDGHSHMSISSDTSYVVAYLLVLALSFHSIFEGIALGTQQKFGTTVSIFIAILTHSPLGQW